MECTQKITDAITWVGGSDRRKSLFENLFPLKNGVTYNAYVIKDEKTALIDTADSAITEQFFENLAFALKGRGLDYLVVNHMEPDHCANIGEVCRRYPGVRLVGNAKTMQLIGQFHDVDTAECAHVVQEGDTLSLGEHSLRFFMMPMVHWPEVMFTLETSRNILFSADAFGTFGGFCGNIFSDQGDYADLYLEEARRYYTNIVGKFGAQVQAALKKLAGQPLSMICPLHGPILRGEAISFLLEKYQLWSAYTPEKQGALIVYASIYGHTENAAQVLAGELSRRGVQDIRVYDASSTHYSEIIARAFEYSHLIFAAPTYNMHLYLPMETVLQDMIDLNLQNRKVAIIGNGSWAPVSHSAMEKKLREGMKGIELLAPPLVLRSKLRQDQMEEMRKLADSIADSL